MKKIILFIFVFVCLIFLSSVKPNAKIYLSTEKDYYSESETILVSEEKLENGYEYKNVHHELDLRSDIESVNIVFNHSDEYLIMGKKNEKPYICYYKQGNLTFENQITDCVYGMFVDAIFDEDKIIVFGEIRYDAEITRLIIVEYSLNGIQTRKQEIYGDDRSEAKRILKINDEYFFVGETLASKLGGCENDGARGIVIGKVQKKSFSDVEIVVFGNDELNYVYDVNCIENRIYLLVHFKGNGYFISGNSSKEFYAIVMFEDRLDMPIYASLKLDNASSKSKIILKDEEVIITSIINKYNVEIDRRSIYLKPIKKERYDFNKISETIENIDAFYKDEKMVFVATYKKNNNLYECRVVLDSENNKVYGTDLIEKENYRLISSNYKDYMFNTLYYSNEEKKYYLESDAFIQKKNDDIYINGCKLKGKEQKVDENEFGDKKIYKEYLSDEFNILITKTIYTPLKVNVKNFSVYDVGMKLEFNATAYLNSKEIKSGYVIEECGNYLLELYGSSGVKESIYFIVDNITKEDVCEVEKKEYNFSVEEYTAQTYEKDITVVNDLATEKVILKTDWYYFAVFFILGAFLADIIYTKIERKKNND